MALGGKRRRTGRRTRRRGGDPLPSDILSAPPPLAPTPSQIQNPPAPGTPKWKWPWQAGRKTRRGKSRRRR